MQQAGRPGSTIPLLNAYQTGGDPNGEQLSPDDILAASRHAQSGNPQRQEPLANTPNQYALSNVPAFNDPALDAYRRQNNTAYTPPPPPPTPPVTASSAPQPVNESEALKKSSPKAVFG